MSEYPPNQLSYENKMPEMMQQVEDCTDRGDFKDAFYVMILMMSHMLWRIQELENVK